ncbi:hypothetical protein, partial [Kistimonas scapharcae]|uniref:hypothetical protein n=1 Tax=Kistimonas scapharcae TaxID=1036133 RepID=UPI0031E8B21B
HDREVSMRPLTESEYEQVEQEAERRLDTIWAFAEGHTLLLEFIEQYAQQLQKMVMSRVMREYLNDHRPEQ